MIPAVLPYGLLIRAGAVLAFSALMAAGGFKCGKEWGDKALEAKAHELMVCNYDRGTLSEALNEINAMADQAKREAKAQAELTAAAVELSKKDRKAYDRQLGAVADELEEARRSPTCRAQLEAIACAPLH